MIKQSLDCGAHGIVIPWLQRPEDAERIVRAARYSQGPDGPEPRGQRGTCSFNPALRYWGCASFEEYVQAAELWPLSPQGEVLLMFMIEDLVGIENVKELVQVPGVGAVLFGRGDAGQALGSRGRVLEEAQERVLEICKEAGTLVGNVGKQDHEVAKLAEQGWDFVVRDTFAPSGRPTRATTRT
jgi:4-hydroxy-2-oxoheptanedioate aldolase